MISFEIIRARAEKRKGGAAALNRLMPPKPDPKALAVLKDDRVLAEMTKRVFSAGFAWSVIEWKWPGFEEAFLGFEPARLAFEPDEFWERLTKDARIVRNGAKILSVRAQRPFRPGRRQGARQLRRLPRQMAASDEVGLLEHLAKRGDRLGGNTGQMLLRFLGWDGFVASKDVVACLRDDGLDIAEEVKSKRDLKLVQEQFNAWAKETGLSYSHLSRICAYSIGDRHQESGTRARPILPHRPREMASFDAPG